MASASGVAYPAGVFGDEGVGRLDEERPAPERRRQGVEAVEVARAGQRVDEASVVSTRLHEPELVDVARDRRLDGVDAVVAECFDELDLRGDVALLDEAENGAWRSYFVICVLCTELQNMQRRPPAACGGGRCSIARW